ncbi:MAG: SusC/RagA family TonB-linked outer membrane protein [Proteobacteria bacterium]|nr:SusC/RagA family TonB-linked outer membrane protein [Pseudomonadota bacterium]
MLTRLARAMIAGAVALLLVGGVASRAMAQGATVISGKVVNEAGAPVEAVAVTIEATSIGTMSKADGSYTLNVPASKTGPANLIARRIGFKMTSRAIVLAGGTQKIDIVLVPHPLQLSGVTVTALGILAEKTTVGTSQQTLSSEELTRTQSNSIIGAMSGKISGISIAQSGNMGGSTRIVIRGAGSILGENQPLFVLDGIPISNAGFSTATAGGGRDYGTAISDLNPDDIASMTVLKGPNAAALYGSRAANGAVVITTKTGKGSGEGIRFNFTTRMTSDAPSIMPKYQNQYGQGFGGEFQYVDGAGGGVNDGADESWGPKLDGRLIDQFNGKQLPWVAHPNNVSNYFLTGSTVSNNINMTAASKGMGLRLSVTKDNVAGIVPNSSTSKLAGSISGSVQFNDKFSMSGSLNYTQTNGMNRPENGYTEGNPFMTFTWFGRQVDVSLLKNQYYNKNSVYGFPDGSLYNWNDNYHRNPYWQEFMNPAPDSRDRITAQISGTYVLNDWLSGLVRAGNDQYRFTRAQDFAAGNIDNASAAYNGGFTSFTQRAQETNFEGILTAKKSVGKWDLQANVGGNLRNNDMYQDGYATAGILVPGIYNLSNAAITPTVTNAVFHSAVNSAYGSANATFKGYWTVEVTGRNDWSSTLPKANASYFYPSVNTSLVLSDMFPVLTKNRFLSYLKIRGGAAQVGSDAQPYQLQTLYNGSSNKFGSLPLYTLSNTSANPALKPERTTSSEGGVEASFLDDRIILDATYFLKQTKDQIIPLTIAPASGFTATTINAGQISNRGVEAMATWKVLRMKNGFQWTTAVNFAKVNNKVDYLAPGLSTIVIASQWGTNIEARAGLPYGTIFGYDVKRDSATKLPLLSGGLPQRATAKSVLGNVTPDWTGGWSNEVRYKAWSFSALIDVQHGGQNFSIGNWWGTYAGILASTLDGRQLDWNKPGYVAKGIDAATGKTNTVNVTREDYNHATYPMASFAIYNTGFAKLREMRLGYEVPSAYAAKLKLTQMSLALVGRNLFTWTSFPNYDPENAANAGNGGKGFDMGSMPTTRSIGLNISITP